jgi:hypothetical protein
MFEKISNGWNLAKQSLRVVLLDKELLLFPLFSGISSILVTLSFLLPLWTTGSIGNLLRPEGVNPVVYVIVFAFYLVNFFVIVFFNSCLVACALIRFRGGDPTVADGLRSSWSRLPQIFAWSLLAASVGFLLRVFESRSRRGASIVSGFLGIAWSAASYFVIPILVVENLGPIEALKRSTAVLKKSWGEALAANFGLGLLMTAFLLLAGIPAVLGVVAGSGTSVALGLAATALAVLFMTLVQSVAKAVLQAALYLYAADGSAPPQFDESLLKAAFVPN